MAVVERMPGSDIAPAGQFVGRAAALGQVLRERARDCEKLRRLSSETIADFAEAGFFDILKPRRHGGAELDPLVFLRVCIEIARHCGSSAWVLAILGIHNWRLALFPDQAARDVWSGSGETSSLIAASTPPSLQYLFLVPRSDFVIEDDWHVAGLKGTGTNTIVVADAFVPDHRASSEADTARLRKDPASSNDGPVYRYPWGLMLAYAIAAPAIGMAGAAIDHYIGSAQERLAGAGPDAAVNPHANLLIANCRTMLDCAETKFTRNLEELGHAARMGSEPSLDLRARCRWEASWIAGCCASQVDAIFAALGVGALFDQHPLQRIFRDIHALRAHRIMNAESTGENFGRLQVGLSNREFFL
ncbi:MAG: acyl-CoA dehydrogenase family protein [Hyphomicrobiales bacterium]|nr:acyl-CoA dehydrogenase family protein [Hyphomicrobiales bacterium]